MHQGSRPDRVGDQIRIELGELLVHAVTDPGIGFITITRVRTTRDLRLVRVYYTVLGDLENRVDTARALKRANSFLRREVGKRLSLRRVPIIEFKFDEAVESENRIEELLSDLCPDQHEAENAGLSNKPRPRNSDDR